MFITKNIGVNEKVTIYSESKTQPTIKARVIYLFDVQVCDTQRYHCRSYVVYFICLTQALIAVMSKTNTHVDFEWCCHL
jgi:hypothetical protein